MAERDGLRWLQMGEARHDAAGLFLCALDHGELEIRKLGVQRVDLVAYIQAEIRRHLIVARARRVQAARSRADQLREPRLGVHVDVFERAGEFEFAALDLAGDLRQAFGDLRRIFLGDDPLLREHGDMSERAANVLGSETLVKIDGDVNGLQNRVGCALEATAPYLARHFYPGACA